MWRLPTRSSDRMKPILKGGGSVTSPLARALIGKEAGDTAEVTAPGGIRSYEVMDVRFLRPQTDKFLIQIRTDASLIAARKLFGFLS